MKDNKLIAEFMEHENSYKSSLYPNGAYHSSWDWLMPVLEKINIEKYTFKITLCHCDIFNIREDDKEFIMEHNVSTLKATYNAVVKFIKWYNIKYRS